MLFFIYHEDRDGAQDVRKANRAAHLEYVKGFKLLFGGPTLTDDGQQMTGSVLVVDLADRQAAEEFVRNDPYVKAGLFKATTVKRWLKVAPAETP